VRVDTKAVSIENISAMIETTWWPRKRELINVMKDRPAATGWRTKRTTRA
jgi:hypothetical protein